MGYLGLACPAGVDETVGQVAGTQLHSLAGQMAAARQTDMLWGSVPLVGD